MELKDKVSVAHGLLEELRRILEAEGEANSVRGVVAALKWLDDPDHKRGFAEARSLYRTVASGGAPLSEYYIQRADPGLQSIANQRLDELRDELWQLFK